MQVFQRLESTKEKKDLKSFMEEYLPVLILTEQTLEDLHRALTIFGADYNSKTFLLLDQLSKHFAQMKDFILGNVILRKPNLGTLRTFQEIQIS